MLLLELGRAGGLVRSRLSGILAGLKDTVPAAVESNRVTAVDGDGQFKVALDQVAAPPRIKGQARARGRRQRRKRTGRCPRVSRGRSRGTCAIVGQNAEPDARAELRQPQSPLIGSAGYFPERYGAGLIRLAIDILANKPLPPGPVRPAPDGDT